MALQIQLNTLLNLTNSFSYKRNGDRNEILFGDLIIDNFPNSEEFWKLFVTPVTSRIDLSIHDINECIGFRPSISKELVDLSILHYSVFLNLVYAKQCLINKHPSYFENFYTHLGSVCDLAEELITQLYFITLESERKETEVLQRLSKTKFVELARDWFEKHYSSSFEHYLSKGKTAPFKILGRSNILDEYFSQSEKWKKYRTLALQIRTYRNVVVHNTQIGSHITPNGTFVPKKQKIGNYKKWNQVFSISPKKFETDFIERDQQMTEDLAQIKSALNDLWTIPIQHLKKLLYSDLNEILLKKYDLQLQTQEK